MNEQMTDLSEGLNGPQKEAVLCTEGPSLIVAGAGSGKTRVLTCRVAHILENCGCRPGEVLALTFTKKAAEEMKERIARLVGEQKARWIQMGTFHSIFIRFLREYADLLGYPREFTIYDKSDSQSLIKQCIKELNLDEKSYRPASVMSAISLAKNSLVTVKGYRADIGRMEADRASRRPGLVNIYELYQRKCKAAGSMDFDDILLNLNILFRDHPEALDAISSRFRYIMVDEYQDTNFSQYLILKKMAAGHHNICVVGDDSQSIYGFRGARIENILRFRMDYPEAREFKLEQNYRSTRNIVCAANSLIEHNERRLKKECFSKAGDGEKLKIIKAFTESEEGYLVASAILERIHGDKAAYADFAILYRTNAQSRALEEALRKKNIPFRIYGGHSFYERAEIKDMLAYFKLIVNQRDDEAFKRIVNVPARGIGNTSLERLCAAAAAEDCPLFEAALLPFEKLAVHGLKETAVRKLHEFASMIWSIAEKSATADCYAIALEAGDRSGYLVSLGNDTSAEGVARFENLEELFNSIKEYSEQETEMRQLLPVDKGEGLPLEPVTISDYLENIYLMSEVEKDEKRNGDADNSNKVTLMTIHSSKGLEFPHVFITGMEENLFPSESKNDSPDKIEEERRLFYVAITRAERSVTLSFAQTRRKWGSEESNRPSRFLKEIDDRYLETPQPPFIRTHYETPLFGKASGTAPGPAPHRVPNAAPPSGFSPSPVSLLRVGQKIEHDRFGFGTILSFDGIDAGRKAVVRFENGGDKTLLLKFAKLRIVQ